MSSSASKFSSRLPRHPVANALSRRLDALRAAGVPVVDLTESNPTAVGLPYPPDLLEPLSDAGGLRYCPEPFGLAEAREAIAADGRRRGAHAHPSRIVLTASTSEAYAWLFKLLCEPGDAVLVPRPSYPLFEHLTALEGVRAAPYDLVYHGRWEIDFETLAAAAAPQTRAVLLVSPNNPTGSYVGARDHARLEAFCLERGLAIVADEVFADYPLDAPADAVRDLAVRARALTFTLGGLSKCVGLPQLKLGWMVVGGEPGACADALAALELIADSYLSVSTPVQRAAASLLARGAVVRDAIHARLRENLAALRARAARHRAVDVLTCEGGWYAVVRVPATRSEEALILDLLERERVLVHPGYFFDFPREAYLIVSLLPRPDVFADAAARMLQFVTAGDSTPL